MGAEAEVKFFHQKRDQGAGVSADYVFVDHPSYHRPDGLYCNANEGVEYDDNLYRYALFSLAALEVTKLPIGGKPYGEKVVFVASDWQTALLPVYLVHRHRPRQEYLDARCIFVVHNFGFQGIYPLNKVVPFGHAKSTAITAAIQLGLDPRYVWNDLIFVYEAHERRYEESEGHVLNLSKGALQTADRILTVSPGYASEMKTLEGGFQLQDVAKARESSLAGILNGIDVAQWNPMTDPLLATNYGPSTDFPTGRAACKKQLQERLNLKVDADVCVVAFVGRLTPQKGIDIIMQAIDWLLTGLAGHVQLILMGHGENVYGDSLRAAETRYPGSFCGYMGFDPKLERIIYAGSDLFLMPTRYEPCGLAQMYAMRYGCIPIASLCGGLKDSVVTDPPEEATGFGIHPVTLEKFKQVFHKALKMYFLDKKALRAMQVRGMKRDFSWCRAMDQYEQHIDWTLADKPYCDVGCADLGSGQGKMRSPHSSPRH
jgi:starch synthase